MRVIIPVISYAVGTGIEIMPVTSAIIAVMIVRTIVSAAITAIVVRLSEIEVVMVCIPDIDPEAPASAIGVNRAIEIIHPYKTPIL